MLETCGLNYITKNKDKLTALLWVTCAEEVLHGSSSKDFNNILSYCGGKYGVSDLNT